MCAQTKEPSILDWIPQKLREAFGDHLSILEIVIYNISVVDQWNVPYNGRLIKLCGLDYDEGQRVGLVLRSSGVKIYCYPTRGNQISLLCFFSLITHWKSICLINCCTPELSDCWFTPKKRPHMEKQLQSELLSDYVYNNSPSFPKAIYIQPWSNRSLKYKYDRKPYICIVLVLFWWHKPVPSFSLVHTLEEKSNSRGS